MQILFHIAFSLFVNEYNGNWATYGGLTGWMQALKQSFDNNTGNNRLVVNAEAIYSDLGYFVNDNDGVVAVFKSLSSKSDVAFISGYLLANYGVDLLTFLQKGKLTFLMFNSGLPTASDLALIINYVNTLPDV